MDNREGQSLFAAVHNSGGNAQRFIIPRRPLPPQSTISSSKHVAAGKLQETVVVTNMLDHDTQKNDQQAQKQHEYWSPLWVRKWTLLAFIALFTAMAASLLVLWQSNKTQNGFRPSLSSNYYAWTYGPTAILVIVVSLWRQTDYYCKILQPWQEMRRGPQMAAQTILLDYVSPMNVTSFIRAVRYRHLPVLASIAGFTTLKLIILFSTGLLALKPTAVSGTFPVTMTTKFDGSSFWKTISSNGPYSVNIGPGPFAHNHVSASPVHAYLGLITGQISDPIGTLEDRAFQSFETATTVALGSISTRVNVFVPNVSCEVVKTAADNYVKGRFPEILDVGTCSVSNPWGAELTSFGTLGQECSGNNCPPFQAVYDMCRVNCSGSSESLSSFTPLDLQSSYDIRYAVAVANVSYFTYNDSLNNTITNKTTHEFSIIMCKVDYSINEATVTYEHNENSYHLGNLVPGPHLGNLTSLMLGEMVYSSFGAANDLILTDVDNHAFQPAVPFFYTLLRTLHGTQSMDRFLSVDTLQQSATQAFEGMATQFMQQFYLVSDNETTTGIGIYTEDRLHIGMVSLWAMVVGFALLILFSLIVMLTVLPDKIPQDPGIIATSATILSTSTDLQKLLHGTGKLRTSQLVDRLRGWTFQTKAYEKFTIDVGSEKSSVPCIPEPKSKHGFWIPYAARYWMVALTFSSPLIVIAVLEIVYRVSVAKMGLLDVSNSEETALYLSRYISAAVMLLIATNFNGLDFAIASFAPFSLLRSGTVSASRSLQFDLLREMPPIALFQSLRTRHLSSALSNSAGIIGSVLTVVASGLWMIDSNVGSNVSITASVANIWNVTWPESALNDGGAAVTFDRIEHGSAKFPSSIWNDLVFPDIADVQKNAGSSSIVDFTSRNFTLDVPAIRPVLMCDIVEDEYIYIQWSDALDSTGGSNLMNITALPPLPPGCQMGGLNGTNTYTNFAVTPYSLLPNQPTWIGAFYDIHLGPLSNGNDTNFPEYGDELPFQWKLPDNAAGCPSIGIIFGWTNENATTHDDITVLLCSQKLQQINVKLNYESSSDTHNLSMNRNIAPIPDEGSAQYLNNGTELIDTFPYRVGSHFSANLTYLHTDVVSMKWSNGSEQFFMDSFFDNIVSGPDGISLNDLAGRSNRKRLVQAINKLYNKYMVLVLDMHLREPISTAGLSQHNRLEGTQQIVTSRIRVNFPSKLALQIMLGTMTLLGAAAFWLTDLRGTLPRNPCSIASTMSFFAGSDMCDPEKPVLPPGAEWLKPKELEKVLEGWFFSLGWWAHRQREESIGSRDDRDTTWEDLRRRKEENESRFGIDVGRPERLGFRETKWWTLKRRLVVRMSKK